MRYTRAGPVCFSRALPFLVLFLGMMLSPQPEARAANRLAGHASPYLAQHAQDPVDWRAWGPEVLRAARRDNRLILVSLGYFACHWCHVMQRESWADPEVARLVNSAFVAVKVDREVHASLDASLQSFTERTRGMSGWPLNVFLTPEGYPLFAMTYAPKAEFLRIANTLQARWREDAGRLAQIAREAGTPPPLPGIAKLPSAFLDAALQQADSLRGGFGEVAKFPLVPQLGALLDAQAHKPDKAREEFLRLTLEQMAAGLRDQVAGGFFRYTVDPDWHEPHFEKMLYDNAQLAALYLRAAKDLQAPEYRRVGIDTVDFLLAEMAVKPGSAASGFIASLSAVDARNREGGAYLWDKAELSKALAPEVYRVAQRVWALDRAAVFAAGYLPVAYRAPRDEELPELNTALKILKGLRAQRAGRDIPRDVKALAGWNGLALAALAAAAAEAPRLRAEADALYGFISSRLWDGKGLAKGEAGGRRLAGAELEDYAYVAHGVAAYADLSGKPAARQFLKRILGEAWRRFHDGSAMRLEESALLAGALAKPWEDGHTPAPAALLAAVTLRHGDAALAGKARQAIKQARPGAAGNPFWWSGLAGLVKE